MTVTFLHPVPVEAATPPVGEHRRALIAERARTRYVRRLLQAHLDLAVADAVGTPVHDEVAAVPGLPEPPCPEALGRLLGPDGDGDLVHRLGSLRDALREVSRYQDALDEACESSTAELIAALRTQAVVPGRPPRG